MTVRTVVQSAAGVTLLSPSRANSAALIHPDLVTRFGSNIQNDNSENCLSDSIEDFLLTVFCVTVLCLFQTRGKQKFASCLSLVSRIHNINYLLIIVVGLQAARLRVTSLINMVIWHKDDFFPPVLERMGEFFSLPANDSRFCIRPQSTFSLGTGVMDVPMIMLVAVVVHNYILLACFTCIFGISAADLSLYFSATSSQRQPSHK